MLEYTLQEAKELLENKLDTNQNALKNVLEDLEFLREQVTTMEVSILLSYLNKKIELGHFYPDYLMP
jgi:hypothetical protein